MTEGSRTGHFDLERLADHARGELGPALCDEVEAHLAACPACRIEAKRLARFLSLDGDGETAAAADWPRARFALARAYEERIRPVTGRRAAPSLARRSGRILRWVVPAAAAATLVLVLWNPGREPGPPSFPVPDSVLRGDEVTDSPLTPTEPQGHLGASPVRFAWSAAEPFDGFELEIFTPDLEVVYRREGIAETALASGDSLQALLAPGVTYLWTVTGYQGLTPAAVSPSAWFRIADEKPSGQPGAGSR